MIQQAFSTSAIEIVKSMYFIQMKLLLGKLFSNQLLKLINSSKYILLPLGILFPTTFLTTDFHTITNISHLMYLHNLNLLVLRKLYVMKVGNGQSNMSYLLLLRLTLGSLLLYLPIKIQLDANGFSKSSSKLMDPFTSTRLDQQPRVLHKLLIWTTLKPSVLL